MANTIQATFGLDINPLKAGFNQAGRLAASAGRTIGSHLTGFITSPLASISAAVAGFLTYETFRSGIAGVIATGSELQKLHQQTGLNVGSLATLHGLFRQADVSADGLGHTVAIMQRNLFQAARTGGPAGSALRLLHLDIDQIIGLRPEVQFQRLGAAIAGLPSPLARTAAAMTLFGRSGQELLPVFEELGNADFGNLSQKAALLAKDSEKFHQITVGFRQAKSQLSGVFLGMADQLAPLMLGLSKLLSAQNAIHFGEVLGQGIRTAASYLLGAFADPAALGDLVGNGLMAGFATADNFLAQGLVTGAAKFAEAMLSGLDTVVRYLTAGLTWAGSQMLGVIKDGLIGVLSTALEHVPGNSHIAGYLAEMLGGAKGIDTGKGGSFDDILARTGSAFGDPAKRAGALAQTDVGDLFNAEGYKDAAARAAAKLKAAGQPVLDVLEGFANSASKASTAAALGSLTNNGGLLGATMAMGAADFASRFSGGFAGGLLFQNGVTSETGALANKSAFGQSPLLSVAERRGFENSAVARGETRGGSTASAFSAIRSGDHARRREEERNRIRAKEGQEKANQLLEGILDTVKDGLIGQD